jgi:hypothetical protein
VAKTRKTARKSGAKRVSGAKKSAAKGAVKKSVRKTAKKPTRKPTKKAPAAPTELDLRPLKKQLREHVEKLTASRSSDPRVQSAMGKLQRLYAELGQECTPTMTLPLA